MEFLLEFVNFPITRSIFPRLFFLDFEGSSQPAHDAMRSLAEGARCKTYCGNRLQTA